MAAAMVVDIVFDMVVDNGYMLMLNMNMVEILLHMNMVVIEQAGKHGVALYHGSGMIIVRGSGFR